VYDIFVLRLSGKPRAFRRFFLKIPETSRTPRSQASKIRCKERTSVHAGVMTYQKWKIPRYAINKGKDPPEKIICPCNLIQPSTKHIMLKLQCFNSMF